MALRGVDVRVKTNYICDIRPMAVRFASVLASGLAIMSEAGPLGLFS